MLNYGAPLLVLTLALASASYQKQQFVVPRQNGECVTVEHHIDDSGRIIRRFVPCGYCPCSRTTLPKPTITTTTATITTPKPESKCPPPEQVCPSKEALLALGYERLPGFGFYKLSRPTVKSYQDAKELCEKEGAHLVVNSEAEAKALNTFIDRVGVRWWYWAGYDDHETEGQFRTIFNQTAAEAGFAKLYPGEPAGGRAENCGVYWYNGNNYGLGDGNCAAQYWYICERDEP